MSKKPRPIFAGANRSRRLDRATIPGKVRYTSGQRETQPVAVYSRSVRDGSACEKSKVAWRVVSPHGCLILAVTRRMG